MEEERKTPENTILLQDIQSSRVVSYASSPDNLLVQWIIRLYSIFPLFAMTFSTINQVFSVGKTISSQGDSINYNENVEVISNGEYAYFTCEYGNAVGVIAYCPYETIPAFQSILFLWVMYFATFICLRLWVTSFYATNDLRFYVATALYNKHLLNKVFVYIGLLFTAVSLAVGIYYLSPQTDWNDAIDTSSALSLVVFLGVNLVALSRLLHVSIGLPDAPITMESFPDEISLIDNSYRQGWKKIFTTPDRVIQPILSSYVSYLVHRDEKLLIEHGKPSQLIAVMEKIYVSSKP